ncbi:hypothetical protein BDY24DRAFT_416098 [Mrakia frigida]|uniref:uncharacterized protein n=1 Tax=Mrakia frigida TaxID=29902 RepID=UPI003FCBFB2F
MLPVRLMSPIFGSRVRHLSKLGANVACDNQDKDTQGGGGVLEGAGGGSITVGGGSSSSTFFLPLPSLPEITTMDDSLPPLSPNNKAPTISPTHRFPRPLHPSSRSSSPKPTPGHHLGNPLLPHATPTGRNRVLSTSSIASNHTPYSIATYTTPPPPASASTLVNKGRIVSASGPHGESTSTSSSAPLSPSEDFDKLPQSPTTLPPGGLLLPGLSRHSFSSLREGASSPRLGATLPPSAVPFGLTREGGSWARVRSVSIFSLLDGLCLSTAQIPSTVASSSSSSLSSFVWNSMAISKSASTYRAIITGSATTSPWDPSFSSFETPPPSRSSKIVVLDLEEISSRKRTNPHSFSSPPLPLLRIISSPSLFTLTPILTLLQTPTQPPQPQPPPSSPPPPAPSSHSTDLSAKAVARAFKDLFHRASTSSKPTNSTTDGAGGLAAGEEVDGAWPRDVEKGY